MANNHCHDEENPGSGDQGIISVRRRMNALVINLLIVGSYLVVGGAVISAIELPGEEDRRKKMWVSMQTMYISNGQTLGGSSPEAVNFRQQMSDNLGCSVREMSHDYDFDFTGSIFFALTVVSTIGYGNFTPVTVGGQIFVVMYSVLGISLILNFMFQASYLWLMIVKGLGQRFCKINIARPRGVVANISFDSCNESGSGEIDAKELRATLQTLSGIDARLDESIIAYCFMKADPNRTGRLDRDGFLNAVSVFLQIWPTIPKGADIRVMLASFFVITLWTFIWGSAVGSEEGWNMRESLWFGFVSLTTIGFGDYSPESHMGRIQAFMFIFVGLGMVAWLISSVTEVWSKKTFWKFQRWYEEGVVSEKWMDIRGYTFKSPLGTPSRMKIGPFVSKKPPRLATLTHDYAKTINSEKPGPKRDVKEKPAPSPLSSKKKSFKKEKEREKEKPKQKTEESSIEMDLDISTEKGLEYQELKEEPEKKQPSSKKKSNARKESIAAENSQPPSSPTKAAPAKKTVKKTGRKQSAAEVPLVSSPVGSTPDV